MIICLLLSNYVGSIIIMGQFSYFWSLLTQVDYENFAVLNIDLTNLHAKMSLFTQYLILTVYSFNYSYIKF